MHGRKIKIMTFYLPQFFCPKILAQNTESYNGKQSFKIRGIEQTFKERSLEKLRFGSERVVTGVTREKSRSGRAGEWFCNYKKGVTGATGEGFSGTQRMTNVTYIMRKWTI